MTGVQTCALPIWNHCSWRSNAKTPAYKVLPEKYGIEAFTPLKWILAERAGKTERRQVPFVADLLFVKASRFKLDPVVESITTLQYRYVKGLAYRQPLTVRTADMERFIKAVNSDPDPQYYSPDEITDSMLGRRVRIVGGPLDGNEGNLLAVRGSRRRRLLIEIPSLIVASVEADPQYIRFI